MFDFKSFSLSHSRSFSCAFTNTPKYQQVRGKGKIVTKKWIEACFNERKRIPWRRFALDTADQDEPESEAEIHVEKKASPAKPKLPESGSEDDMVVVDKRVKNGEEAKPVVIDSDDDMAVVDKRKEKAEEAAVKPAQNVMEVSTDDELMLSFNGIATQADNQIFKNKTFYLNEDLPATDVIKLKNQISSMSGNVTGKPSKADYIITATGKRLPEGTSGEVLTR